MNGHERGSRAEARDGVGVRNKGGERRSVQRALTEPRTAELDFRKRANSHVCFECERASLVSGVCVLTVVC